ncbi:MAG: hypothetical protein GXO45_03165 [Aquificae bacterium]|nr:hypothetical protein [Aquificota bacterium]
MGERLFHLRRYFFASLYTSFIYLALLILILRKDVSPMDTNQINQLIAGLTGVIPAFLWIRKKTNYIFLEDRYKKLLFIGHLPLIVGFILSVVNDNYIYFFITYPVFLLGHLIIFPTEREVSKGGKGNKTADRKMEK